MDYKIKNRIFILSGFFIIGLVIATTAVIGNHDQSMKVKNYIETTATLIKCNVSSKSNGNKEYTLIYSYNVTGDRYELTVDYGTSKCPAIGTINKIMYNPNNPIEAVIIKIYITNIIVGAFFMIFSLIPLVTVIQYLKESFNPKIAALLMYFFLMILGILIYLLLCLSLGSFSLTEVWMKSGMTIIMPLIIIIFGIYGILLVLFGRNILSIEVFTNNYEKNDMPLDAKNINKRAKGNILIRISKTEFIISKNQFLILMIVWFAVLLIIDIIAIKGINNDGNIKLFISLIFWVIGISILRKYYKSKEKENKLD